MSTENQRNRLLAGGAVSKKEKRIYIMTRITTAAVILIVLIILIATIPPSDDSPSTRDWTQEFLNGPSAQFAKENSRLFSGKAHIAATPQNNEYASDIQQQFETMGMAQSDILVTGNIYLSSYNGSSLYQVNATNTDETLFEFDLSEEYIAADPTSNTTLRRQAWLGYSASGTVTGYVVYVNYGAGKDFDVLLNTLNFDLQNQSVIALVRYGALLRGIKALNAADYGFKAVMVFSDPQDYGFTRGDVVPDGPFLPDSGFQRGSAAFFQRCFGNPSPERALERCGFDDVSHILPSIPIIPLSYGNARRLMEQMSGSFVNDSESTVDWQGGMQLEYRIGTVNENDGVMVRLSASTIYAPTEIQNVRGFIPGSKYPNESILYGAHRDAWVFGAVDPVSGTTSIIEVARAFTRIYDMGWRPKRNIYFLSWDAEEFDLIGSTGFGEEYEELLQTELVAYLNQDQVVSGPNFRIRADPLIEPLALECMKKVRQPYLDNDADFESVYDNWAKNRSILQTEMLGSGSDFTVFVHEYGITSMDSRFTGGYGTYHSIYDSYFTMSTYIDPDYEYLRAAASVVGLIGFELVNNDIIPFSVYNLYIRLNGFLDLIDQLSVEYDCSVSNELTQQLSAAMEHYGEKALLFEANVNTLKDSQDTDSENYKALVIRYNSAMRTLGSKFLYEDGLPTRKIFKNLIVAAAVENGYGHQVLPYIAYAIKFECGDQDLLEEAYNITANAIYEAGEYLESFNY